MTWTAASKGKLTSHMPSALLRACSHYGCQNASDCPEHGRKTNNRRSGVTQKAYDHRRGSAYSRGYTKRWDAARLAYLSQHPLCSTCDKVGHTTIAAVVDHVVPHRGDMALFWDEGNWQPLCKRCHDTKTWNEVRSGMHKPSRTVVCGLPGSGKTTWVSRMAKPWDIVWDLDAIASVVSYQGKEIPRDQRGQALPWATSQSVLAMREGFFRWLETADIHTANVYIIVSDKDAACKVAARVHASLVSL